jgi:hypothetical protein
VLTLPDSMDIVQTYSELAQSVAKELNLINYEELRHNVKYDAKLGKVVFEYPDIEEDSATEAH